MSKPINVISNNRIAIVVHVLAPTNTKPQRYKISLGRISKVYSRPHLSDSVKEGAEQMVKQFIIDHDYTFSSNDSYYTLSTTPNGFVAVAIPKELIDKVNQE